MHEFSKGFKVICDNVISACEIVMFRLNIHYKMFNLKFQITKWYNV